RGVADLLARIPEVVLRRIGNRDEESVADLEAGLLTGRRIFVARNSRPPGQVTSVEKLLFRRECNAAQQQQSQRTSHTLSLVRYRHRGLFGTGRAIGAWLGSPEIHPAFAVTHHRFAVAHHAGESRDRYDYVAAPRQFLPNRLRHAALHLDIASLESQLGEPRRLERHLDVHAEINHIRDKPRVRLRLVPSAHDAEADRDAVLLHEGRDDGVQRTLASGKRVGLAGLEFEARAAIVEGEAGTRRDVTGPVARIV